MEYFFGYSMGIAILVYLHIGKYYKIFCIFYLNYIYCSVQVTLMAVSTNYMINLGYNTLFLYTISDILL